MKKAILKLLMISSVLSISLLLFTGCPPTDKPGPSKEDGSGAGSGTHGGNNAITVKCGDSSSISHGFCAKDQVSAQKLMDAYVDNNTACLGNCKEEITERSFAEKDSSVCGNGTKWFDCTYKWKCPK
jgi:hypothetical protein